MESTRMDQESCSVGRRRTRIQFREDPASPNPCESDIISEEVLEDFSTDNLDRILGHCFKQFKLRDAFPRFFFKVKPSRFGPPKSRRRILIAPPMGEKPPFKPQSRQPAPKGPQQSIPALEMLPEPENTEEEDLETIEAWIAERKQLWNLLNNCVNLEQWLTGKQSISELEENVLERIKEFEEAKKAKWKAQSIPVVKTEVTSKKVPKKIVPIIKAPFPASLMTLQNLLHKQKLKLVDIFSKDKTRKTFRRVDFIKIIQETKVPISMNDLEDAVIYLTSSKKGDCITSDDLAECQQIWQENVREQGKQDKAWRQEKGKSSGLKGASSKMRHLPSPVPTEPKLDLLEVPPFNTEPDYRYLTYNQMEMAGKRFRDMKRLLKRKTSPLQFAEQCRMVKSGDRVVDAHCKPSTIQGEMGELVDQHRLATYIVFAQCVKLCEKYGIPLSERLLKRALLFPGDCLITDGNNVRKIRQPGGYYNRTTSDQQTSGSDQSRSSSREKTRRRQPEVKKKLPRKTQKTLNCRWKSFEEFEKLTRPHSKRLLPPFDFPPELELLATPEALAEQYIERELRRMFSFLNPLTDPNSFWPGRRDKLRLYLPHEEPSEGDCLFSHVLRTRPVYPAVYNPHRCWPVSDQGYMTYGDPEFRKHNYYI